MEFGNRAISCFEHLHEDQRGDGCDVVRGQLIEELIHQAHPTLEAVVWICAAGFGWARHSPLKGMAVKVERCRQQQFGPVGRFA